MKQFVFVPVYVYNKSLKTQSVTKQEAPKYQDEQNPKNQVEWVKKESTKKCWKSKLLSR